MPIFFLKEVIGVLRLYHHKAWDVSDQDVESLLILGEQIGLAMMFSRLLNTMQAVRESFKDLPPETVPLACLIYCENTPKRSVRGKDLADSRGRYRYRGRSREAAQWPSVITRYRFRPRFR